MWKLPGKCREQRTQNSEVLTVGFIAWFNNNHARLLEFENYRGYKGIFNRRNTPKGHYDVR